MKTFKNQSIEHEMVELYKQNKWQDIIKFTDIIQDFAGENFRLFWVLPSLSDLSFIESVIRRNNLRGIISIGCGCGLFEWLFQRYSGLEVVGVEVDKSWWCSKYAPTFFLQNMKFVAESDAAIPVPQEYALLFCYFNNGAAFRDYINKYEGSLVLVIGPEEGQSRMTDPMPLDAKFQEHGWTLVGKWTIVHSSDCITAYNRVMPDNL